MFLLHCPAGHPDWVLPSALPYGVRTFLDPTSLPTSSRDHPADLSAFMLTYNTVPVNHLLTWNCSPLG